MEPFKFEIKLTSPIVIDGKTVSTITLRAPTLQELQELGEPVQIVQHSSGVDFIHRHFPVIDAYARRLIVAPPNAAEWIDGLSFSDGYQVIDAVEALFLKSDNAAREAAPFFPASARTIRR